MKIFNYAKELTKETGRQVTANDIIRVLSKKRDGLKMSTEIDDELMEYAKMMITGKSMPKKAAPAKAPAAKPAAKKPAAKSASSKSADSKDEKKTATKRTVKRSLPRPGEGPKDKPDGLKKKEAAAKAAEEEAAKKKVVKTVKVVKKVIKKKNEDGTEEIKEVKTVPVEQIEAEKEAAAKKAAEKKAAEEAAAKAAEKAAEKNEEKSAAKPAKTADTKKTAKSDSKSSEKSSDKPSRRPKPAKNDAAPAPEENKKRSSGRKGDKSKDKEKEARRENKESRSRREEKRSKKNVFRDMDEMTHERKKKPKKQEKKEEETIKTVTLPESLTLSEFASKIKQPVNALIKKLFMEGKMYTVNTELSYEEAELIALEYNIICEQEVKVDIVEEALKDIEDPEDSLVERPPVVCVMGHVDHGKTSLLDAIRKTSVTEGEAGGITQHIGAYTVKVNGKKITFLDTPGHEAFTAMRLRGAMATDIAILVVAADDGVMPQTVEAINHAKAAGIEIIVAVNKIDKPSANIERVKQELVEYGLISEDWGGNTVFAPVSAKSHEGIDNLLEMILLTSDILELKANPKRKARGIVIEAKLDKGRGAVATLLVQKGTLKVGDFIAIGESHGRVRAMTDDKQRALKEATPSMPVEVIGLSTVPNTGEIFIATDSEKEARNISDAFVTRGKENLIAETKAKMSLDDIFSQMQEGTLKELNIIIKADVQGSVEALKQSLLKLSNDEILIKCIHSGVGAINESDVTLAGASDAIIIGFNVRPEPMAKQLADSEKVDIRLYKVIYNAIDDIESAMKGMLDPIFEEKVIGHGVIRQTFKASGVGTIAGTFVEDGAIERAASARISRDGEQIWDGKIASLKRFNDDAKEVKAGYECGIVFEDFNDVRENDTIEVYKMVEVPRD